MRVFDIADWYWIVGGDDTKFWSSASAGYVTAGEPGYIAFIADGNSPQIAASKDALLDLFAEQYPGGALVTYANAQQWALATGGYVATVGDQQIPFKTDVSSLSLITGKVVSITQPGGPSSVDWQVGQETIIEVQAADFVEAAKQVDSFVQGTFTKLKGIFAKIDDGTYTSRDQIDQALAA